MDGDGATKEGLGFTEVGKGAKLKDSNMANYGSKEHKDLMKRKAENEKEYKGAGEEVGIEVWRAENVKVGDWGVKRWPKEKFGRFFDGDSYIVLETRMEEDKMVYDVYYWLGQNSSTDERAVVAMKTVELDDLLGGKPIQHRVLQGGESRHFKKLFGGSLTIDAGGIASGFRRVKGGAGSRGVEQITLWCVKGKIGKKKFMYLQMPLEAQYVEDDNVYVLSRLGGKENVLLQWNGHKSSGAERALGGQLISMLRAQPGCGHASRRVIDGEDDKEFFASLKGGFAAKGTHIGFDLDGDGVIDENDRNDAMVAAAIKEMRMVNIWKVKLEGMEDARLDPEDIQLIHCGPVDTSKLTSDGVYFIGTIPSFMIVYFGKDVPKRFHSLTMRALEGWIAQQKLNNLRVTRLVEGCPRHARKFEKLLGIKEGSTK